MRALFFFTLPTNIDIRWHKLESFKQAVNVFNVSLAFFCVSHYLFCCWVGGCEIENKADLASRLILSWVWAWQYILPEETFLLSSCVLLCTILQAIGFWMAILFLFVFYYSFPLYKMQNKNETMHSVLDSLQLLLYFRNIIW